MPGEIVNIGIRVSPEDAQKFREIAINDEITQQELFGRLLAALEEKKQGPDTEEHSTNIPIELQMELAAKTIIENLSAHYQETIEMVCSKGYNGLAPWRWLKGALRLIIERGDSTCVILDDSELQPLVNKMAICPESEGGCGETFTPSYWGQKFCKNACGARANKLKEELAKTEPVSVEGS